MTPEELNKTVKLIRDTSNSLGSFKKIILGSEKENRKKLKKSIVSKKFIEKGKKLNKNLFEIKRPGTGILPKFLNNINEYSSTRNIQPDTTIKNDMIKKIPKKK
jgi:sialic acid synthase SpsE